MYAVLGGEPWCYRPWEVGRLTLYQLKRILFAPRDDKGSVIRVPSELRLLKGQRVPTPEEMLVSEMMYLRGVGEDEAKRLVAEELARIREDRQRAVVDLG